MIITLYSPEISSRLRYIVAYLFTDLLGISVELTTDISHFQEVSGVAVNYSKQSIREREVHLCPVSLLFARGVEEQQLQSGIVAGVPYCFAGPPGYDLPFDPLAAAFFVLSRYEEYLPHEKDQHGRYPAAISWLSRNAALDRPILWEWAKLVRATIQNKYPAWEAPQVHRQYRFLPTYDIDIPWAYCHRGWRGWVRAWMDRLTAGPEHLQARRRAQLNASDDPYFTFPQLEQLHQKNDLRSMVFWLVADRAKFDVNPNPDLPAFQDLVREVANWSDIGLHPSYQRGQDASGVTMEKQRLENILQQPIKCSRQHFLRLSLPHTYRQLLAAGIEADYSMGYAAQPGFRAGTSEPFYWYDLEKEEATALRVHPFAVMDVTLKQYQGMAAAEAQVYLQEMQSYCKREGLSFCTLWHNSSFSPLFGWDEEWWSVYQSLF
ncbi:MAG: polysaccharide deacetylase family protein [Bacteroidota bacterium]